MERKRRKYIFRCAVKSCMNTKDTLFKIPTSDFEAWCHNLQLEVEDVKSYTRVCSRHFQPKDIGLKRIRLGARPTLNLGHDNVIPSDLSNIKRRCARKCCIFGCTTTSPPSVLYRFPTDPVKAQLWRDRCHSKMDVKSEVKKYICGNHFDKKMIGNGRILSNAIPYTIIKCTDCKTCRNRRRYVKRTSNVPNIVENNGDNLQTESFTKNDWEHSITINVISCEDYEKCIDNLQSASLPISRENTKSCNVETCVDNEDDLEQNSLQMDTSENSNLSTVENYDNSEDNHLLVPLPINNMPNAFENSSRNAVETCEDHENNHQMDSLEMDTSENLNPSTLEKCGASDSIFLDPLPINNIPNILENNEENLELSPCDNPMPYVIENCSNDLYDIQFDPLDENGCKNCSKLNHNIEDHKKSFLKEIERSDCIKDEYNQKRLQIQQEIDRLKSEVNLWKTRFDELSCKNKHKNEAAAFASIIDPERNTHCTSFQIDLLVKLYTISRQAYTFMRKELKFNLPNEITLYRWIKKSKRTPSLTQKSDSTQNPENPKT